MTYAELAATSPACKRSLQAAGVGWRSGGGVHAQYLANPGGIARTHRGGDLVCSSPDFGTQGVIDRFGQIDPRC